MREAKKGEVKGDWSKLLIHNEELLNLYTSRTECCSVMISTPSSYSGGPRFDTQPRVWLS